MYIIDSDTDSVLRTIEDFCFPEPTGHHHSSTVTVSAVKVHLREHKFTYLLIYIKAVLKTTR